MEEVIYSWEMWTKDLSENPPSPDPRYYDSEKQCAISDFESQSAAESDSDEPPRLIPLPERRQSSSSNETSSDSEDSSSSSRTKPNKSRKQTSRQIKEVNNRVDEVNVNLGNIDGRILGIEDKVGNISEELIKANRDLNAMNADQKSSNKALKTTVENHSRVFDDKFLQIRSEMKNLQSDFKKSQEFHEESTKNFKAELKKSQELQEDSMKELKKFQVLHEDSSKKLSDLLAHLKEDKKKSENSNEIIYKFESEATNVQMVDLQSKNGCDLSTAYNSFPAKEAAKLDSLSMSGVGFLL